MAEVGKVSPVLDEKRYAEHVEEASSFSHGATDHASAVKVPARIFTKEEEDKLYRKVDLRLMPILAVLYLLSFMDRGNIGNARIEGLEKELGMTSQDYNTALSCFFITYCLCEVPANLIMKKFRRPSVWLGLVTTTWAVVMTCMGVVQSFGGLLAARLCLGIAEAGLFPGVILYLSIWYPRYRSQSRIGFFFGAATLAGAFSGLLAYAIGFMSGVGGYAGWRWIFILEGLATLVVGISAFWLISDYPADCHWLTEEEKEWLIYCKATDNSSVGEAEHVSKKFVWSAFTTWQTWLSIGYYLGVVVPLYAISLISPTLISGFGHYTRPQIQLLTVPYYVAAFIFVMGVSILADRWKTRFPFMMLELVLCVIGLVINLSPAPSGVKYFGIFLIACGAYGGLPTSVAWLSTNLSGQTKRAVGSAAQIGLGNLGALASSNVYRTQDKPHYYLGHSVVLAFTIFGMFCAPAYAWMLRRENARKEAYLEQQAMLPAEARDRPTVEELRALGDKAPEFKYTI
jgi:sugar phosphate permease